MHALCWLVHTRGLPGLCVFTSDNQKLKIKLSQWQQEASCARKKPQENNADCTLFSSFFNVSGRETFSSLSFHVITWAVALTRAVCVFAFGIITSCNCSWGQKMCFPSCNIFWAITEGRSVFRWLLEVEAKDLLLWVWYSYIHCPAVTLVFLILTWFNT